MIDGVVPENLLPTAIFDYRHASIQQFAGSLERRNLTVVLYLRAAHQAVAREVAPIYSLDEFQSASATLAKRKGSCSQRFACLEAIARARSIATRVRGMWIAGHFWGLRFKLTRRFIPRRILLAWPQFYLDENWVGVESLFNSVGDLARSNPKPFTNDGESLFDAVKETAVDLDGKTASCVNGQCDLSRFVIGDAGLFATRDELFGKHELLQRSWRGVAFKLVYAGRKSV